MKFPLDARRLVYLIALGFAFSNGTLAPLGSAAGELRAYRSETGRFRVGFPGASDPTVIELEGNNFAMTKNNFNYSIVSDGIEFSVETHDIPRVARLMLSSDYILDHSVSGKLADMNAREVDVVQTSFQGEPAREIVFAASDETFAGRMLLVLADRRIYLVGVLHPPSRDTREISARFFESFSFWSD